MYGSGRAAKGAAASSKTAEETLASAAAAAARALISQNTPSNASYVDIKTGQIKSQAGLPPFWQRLQQTQGWLAVKVAPAYTDSDADLSDIISGYTRTYVCHPLLTHPQLLRTERDLTCPGCGQAGCLRGAGMRSSHVTVLEMPVQFRVFSWNLEHVGCSRRLLSTQSEAATFKFGTTSKEFLEANFMPAIFSALPFTWSEKGQLVGRLLSDTVTFQRTHGMSLEAAAQLYNEQAARPVTDIIHTRLELAAEQQRAAEREKAPKPLDRWFGQSAPGSSTGTQAAAPAAPAAAAAGSKAVAAGAAAVNYRKASFYATASPAAKSAAKSAPKSAAKSAAKSTAKSAAKPPLTSSSRKSLILKWLRRSSREAIAALAAADPAVDAAIAAADADGVEASVGGHTTSAAAAGSPDSNTTTAAGEAEATSSQPSSSRAAAAGLNSAQAAAASLSPAADSRATADGDASSDAPAGAPGTDTGSNDAEADKAAAGKAAADKAAAGKAAADKAAALEAKRKKELQLLALDPFDRQGFALRALNSQFAADVYMGNSKRQELLQIAHMQGLPSRGHISLDHVHQLSKRMQGDYIGTLIACGGSGYVLGFWHVHSTSMLDVQQSLKDLRERSMRVHQEEITLVTVDNPHTTKNLLKEAFPSAKVMMDVGHVLFSRLGKRFDKSHPLYKLASKDLALSLFDFNEDDLKAAAKVVRAAFKTKAAALRSVGKADEAAKYTRLSNMHDTQLVQELPLSTWKRTVRRTYGPAERQSGRLAAWYAKYIEDPTMFVAEGKTLIHGGQQGLDKFNNCWHSQLELVNEGLLSDPPGMVMYVKIGTNSKGLTLWQSTRGSSKNESVNLVAEHSLHTTGKMRVRLATAMLGNRFTRFNLRIERSLAAANQSGASSSSSKARVVGFKHCNDLWQGAHINALCQELKLLQLVPGISPSLLSSGAAVQPGSISDLEASTDAGAGTPADAASDMAEVAAAVVLEGAVEYDALPADFDETLLDDDDPDPDVQAPNTAADASLQQPGEQVARQQPQNCSSEQQTGIAATAAAAAAAAAADGGVEKEVAQAPQQQQQQQQHGLAGEQHTPAAASPSSGSQPSGSASKKRSLERSALASPGSKRRSGSGRAAALGVAALTARLVIDGEGDSDSNPQSDHDSGHEGSEPAVKRQRRRQVAKAARGSSASPSSGGKGSPARHGSATATAWQEEAVAQGPGYAIQPVETEQEKKLFFQLLAEADTTSNSNFGSTPSRGVAWDRLVDAFNTAVTAAWDGGQPRDGLRMKNKQLLVKYYNSFNKDGRIAAARRYAEQRAAAAVTAAAGAAVGSAQAAATGPLAAAGMAASSGQQQTQTSRGQQQTAARSSAQQQQQKQQQEQHQHTAALSSQQPNWLATAGAQLPPRPKIKGTGLGGKGGTKKCVPCSLAADTSLLTANQARDRGSVASSRQHAVKCPYCKCSECKKVWDRNKGEVVVDRSQLARTVYSVAHPTIA